MTEARIDLHCHTSFSEDREQISLPQGLSATVPFHPTLSPSQAYDLALARGMTHVTFTDHDTLAGCLDLLARHANPSRLLTGEEVTCFHAGACIHVGVYGLDEADHDAIHAGSTRTDREQGCLRWNVPELLAYCHDRGLAADLKHPLWHRDDTPLTPDALRATLPLFDLVEAINGTRHVRLNERGAELAGLLGRPTVAFTAGSDSHTDSHGRTFTRTWGDSPSEVLASLCAGQCEPAGDHGSHRLLDHDVRACVLSNASGRAGHFVALADDYFHNMPLAAQDLLELAVSGAVAFAVVHEFARQRRLADEVEALFAEHLRPAAPLGDGLNGIHSVAAPAGGAVHGHIRRD